MNQTPAQLLAASNCLLCALTEKQLLAAAVYILNTSGSGGGGGSGVSSTVGAGLPNGTVTGNPGDFRFDTDNSTFWEKTSGSGTNTGWQQLILAMLMMFVSLTGFSQGISVRSTNGIAMNQTNFGVYQFGGGAFIGDDGSHGQFLESKNGNVWGFLNDGSLHQSLNPPVSFPFVVDATGSASGNSLTLGGSLNSPDFLDNGLGTLFISGTTLLTGYPGNKVFYGNSTLIPGMALADLFDVTNAVSGAGSGIAKLNGVGTNLTLWPQSVSLTFTQQFSPSLSGVTNWIITTTNGLPNFQCQMFNGPGAVGSGQLTNDMVVNIGFGQGGGGGQYGAYQMNFDQWEPYWISGAGAAPQVERWMGCSGTNGVQLRPFFYTCDYTGFITEMLAAQDLIFYSDPVTRTSLELEMKNNVATFQISSVLFSSNTNGTQVSTSNTNNPGNFSIMTDKGNTNLRFDMGIAGQNNDGFTGTRPGDVYMGTFNGNGDTNLDINMGGTYVAQLSKSGLLNLMQGGIQVAGGAQVTGALTNANASSSIGNGAIVTQTPASGNVATGNSIKIIPTMLSSGDSAGMFITGAGTGSGANFQELCRLDYTSGYTGSKESDALVIINRNAGVGANLSTELGNKCIYSLSLGTTVGDNIGVHAEASGGNLNAGVLGQAITSKNAAANLGVLAYAVNGGTTPTNIGGAFFLATTPSGLQPFPTNTALYADSGSSGKPIAVFATNGVSATVPGTIVAMIDADGSFKGNGIGLTNISVSAMSNIYRAGLTNVTALASSVTIIFSTPMPTSVGTNYSPQVQGSTVMGTVLGTVGSLTTNGFTVTLTAVVATVGSGPLYYTATANQ